MPLPMPTPSPMPILFFSFFFFNSYCRQVPMPVPTPTPTLRLISLGPQVGFVWQQSEGTPRSGSIAKQGCGCGSGSNQLGQPPPHHGWVIYTSEHMESKHIMMYDTCQFRARFTLCGVGFFFTTCSGSAPLVIQFIETVKWKKPVA